MNDFLHGLYHGFVSSMLNRMRWNFMPLNNYWNTYPYQSGLSMFNSYFQNKVCGNTDFLSLVKDNEICLSNILNILFYGIAKENPTS